MLIVIVDQTMVNVALPSIPGDLGYDDIPESDITTVAGIPGTTALRTVIDIAPDVDRTDLEQIVRDCLDRGLFTVEAAWRRLAQRDMATRVGAALLRRALPRSR